MTTTVKVIADSINPDGKRIVTLQCRYPRFIHAQVLTHRQFSRNAQSSRAMPVKRMLEEVMNDPVVPTYWGKNQPGMQAKEECSSKVECTSLDVDYPVVEMSSYEAWITARDWALQYAEAFADAGYHKQIVNRLLEPFAHISVIITSTEWDNFFELRCHDDAQPEIQELAVMIREAIASSTPKKLQWGEWHMPYVDEGLGETVKRSVACAARVSYNNHDGSTRSKEKDEALHDQLLESGHMSPFEHPARAMRGEFDNFKGWCSYRWERSISMSIQDHVPCPGVTLRQTLDAIGMSVAELSNKTKIVPEEIRAILSGNGPITKEFAVRLEDILGTPASFWNQRELDYREYIDSRI